jgi:glycosyltransferase involved in cell wall biosynthesis
MNNQNTILVAQIGARKHYQEPILFHQWQMLDKLYTDFYCGHNWLSKIARNQRIYQHCPKIIKKVIDRYDPSLNLAKIIHFPALGYKYHQQLKQALPWEKSQINIDIGRKFCQKIIDCGFGNASIVYGFDGSCLELFEYAKSQGLRCILDQTVAERSLIHDLLLEEEKLWSGWSKYPFQVYEGDLKLVQRQQREQILADKIICGSSFVKDSLINKGIKEDKIFVVPLGRSQQTQIFNLLDNNLSKKHNELRILFAGSVGLRKGIQYLLQALRKLKGEIFFTCKVAGGLEIKAEKIKEFSDVAEFLGRVPRSEMKELYAWANVFVLPSICEGSAMVTYEALSWRLPIITTYNTGSIVRDNIDGFIVPIRDSKAIIDKLRYLYHNSLTSVQVNDYQNYFQEVQTASREELARCCY